MVHRSSYDIYPTASQGRSSQPTVLFIAGTGRSGSTLLERALGAMPGYVNVGELIDLFRRVAAEDERCGCGERFSTCPFWREVGERAFGGWTESLVSEISTMQRAVARQRHIPSLFGQVRSGRLSPRLVRYGEVYSRLYRAILDVSGAECVVDASKWPAQALALSSAPLDLRVINLVRDARGVAYSMAKRQNRPHALAGTEMERRGSAEAAARWMLCHAETALLAAVGTPLARMDYEDLVASPRRAIPQALTSLGLSLQWSDLGHVLDDGLVLPTSHGISGNPNRFHDGTVLLTPDDAWARGLPKTKQHLVAAIASPAALVDRLVRAKAVPKRSVPTPADGDASRSWPLVSVVVTTRGRPELVRETLAGIVAQDYPGELEILVVHDQEDPDPDLESMSVPGRTVRVVLNTEHAPGLAGARNTGVELAAADFIATSDDDDVWHPGKLTAQVRRLLDEPSLLAVGSGIRLLFPGRRVDWHGRSDHISHTLLLRNRVKELHSSTLVMRRDAFSKAGPYAEDLPHGYAEDYEFVLRVAQAGSIGVVREPLADIRRDNQSWFLQRAENTAEALEFLLASHPEITRSRRGHARVLGQIAFAKASMGQRSEAFRHASQALLRYPLAAHAHLAIVQAATGVDPRSALSLARRFGRGLS